MDNKLNYIYAVLENIINGEYDSPQHQDKDINIAMEIIERLKNGN